MESKEKAKQLVQKFRFYQPHNLDIPTVKNIGSRQYKAKQCALICVDEILEVVPIKVGSIIYENDEWTQLTSSDAGKYWQEVKQEINNL